ncbi:hypothetical protein JTE90_019092 [Oedothorax gibbosus]|uniref:Transposase n=1 Tax=Oedothorax gibbosus TaxID=931172 RepID=A0AAV6V8F6_9ARAC|nr:hypothetical protein JTE90_019092 [Oedothorax gibbosus]
MAITNKIKLSKERFLAKYGIKVSAHAVKRGLSTRGAGIEHDGRKTIVRRSVHRVSALFSLDKNSPYD